MITNCGLYSLRIISNSVVTCIIQNAVTAVDMATVGDRTDIAKALSTAAEQQKATLTTGPQFPTMTSSSTAEMTATHVTDELTHVDSEQHPPQPSTRSPDEPLAHVVTQQPLTQPPHASCLALPALSTSSSVPSHPPPPSVLSPFTSLSVPSHSPPSISPPPPHPSHSPHSTSPPSPLPSHPPHSTSPPTPVPSPDTASNSGETTVTLTTPPPSSSTTQTANQTSGSGRRSFEVTLSSLLHECLTLLLMLCTTCVTHTISCLYYLFIINYYKWHRL